MDRDPVSQNIAGVQSLVGSKTNKSYVGRSGEAEGVQGDFENELTLSLDDSELLDLARKIEQKYATYEPKIKLRQQANEQFYKGKQKNGTPYSLNDEAISANLIFEATETFIPAALAKNPEPVVWTDNTPEGNKIAQNVKAMLQYHADVQVLRRKLALATRKWTNDMLGVLKHGWNGRIQDIETDVRDAKKFVFDPEGYVDSYGDFVGILGERITVTAARLVELFPKHKEFITAICEGKMGTDCTYTEWWNDDYTFSTFKGRVLDKSKNPNFNYDQVEKGVDAFGAPMDTEVKGRNHFSRPKKPYTFLSVFSLGNEPYDITGLIEQNIPNQRRISKRTEQIDYNLSRQNNSTVFSSDNFTQEEAKQAATGMAKGNPILVPKGRPIAEAIQRFPAEGLSDSFFKELENSKTDLRTIYGTQGITAQQDNTNETARGMILDSQHDSSRIGGGIGDVLEQVADNIFNWWVQMYYVFYDEPHFAAVLGQMKAVEYVTLNAQSLDRRIVVSVSPNSMKPKDETSEMNMALELWKGGALDPKTLLTILDFPDPQTTAAQAVLWRTNPQLYMQLNFPDLAQLIATTMPMQPTQPGQPGPVQNPTSPPESLAAPQANPSLSQVPISTPAAPTT